MPQFTSEFLRDRIYACWMGKNIGGTLGTFSAGTGWQIAGWTGVAAVGATLATASLLVTLLTRH